MRIVLRALPGCLVLAAVLAPLAGATPPEPTYSAAVVDGNPGEWGIPEDLFSDMYRAGNPAKPVEAYLYLRYDCATGTMYVLVLPVDGVPLVADPEEAWVAIDRQNNKVVLGDSGMDGEAPDFEWIALSPDSTTAGGYEASFPLDEGSYEIIVHTNVIDDGMEQTAGTPGFPGSGPILEVMCGPTPVESASWSRIKLNFR